MLAPLLRAALFVVAYLGILVGTSLFKGMAPPALADLAWGTLSSIALLALTLGMLRREQQTTESIGLRLRATSGARLLAGFALGAGVYALTLAVISLSIGPLRFTPPTWPSPARWTLAVVSYLALSSMEELGFRGYVLRTLVPAVGAWPAQLAVAVTFGLTHIAYGWTWTTVVMGVIPSALLFGAVALRSGGLAMPVGVHAALNLAQWVVGEKDTAGVWTISASAEHTARLTTAGPVVATAMMLLAVVLVSWWPRSATSADRQTPRYAPR
jgi:hypothetical protein